MRIAVAQINPTLADFETNALKIKEQIQSAKDRHCDLVLFPEASLFGYHPFDLLEFPEFVEIQLQFLSRIHKQMPEGIVAVFGALVPTGRKRGRPFFNSAVVLEKGRKPKYFHKELLPTGDVFDEARFIEPGEMTDNLVRIRGRKILITICEDIWAWPTKNGSSPYLENPLQRVAKKHKKVDLVLNLSASPFYSGKEKIRLDLVSRTAKLFKAPMIYCNLVGAQDEIIFDGQSFAVDRSGKLILRLSKFEEDFGVLDLEKKEGTLHADLTDSAEKIRAALVLGIRDFCHKSGLTKVHLGLSGGIDSAVVACLAADAIGPANVATFALPSQFNAPESLQLARELAKNLGVSFQELSIQETFETLKSKVDASFDIQKFGLVHENLQARIRGVILMAFSNLKGSLLLGTGNKSELAAGYSTLYGDLCGGLLPIGDLTKEEVYLLADLYNREREIIPKRVIERAPSAELRPNQKDQDSLPPYPELDQAVRDLVVDGKIKKSSTHHWLFPQLLKSEFKRWQAPPILKVSRHSFGRGRRWPIAHAGQKQMKFKT